MATLHARDGLDELEQPAKLRTPHAHRQRALDLHPQRELRPWTTHRVERTRWVELHLMREAIRGHQRSSEVIRGHQRSSEVIRGHQRSSEVIRRTEPIEEIILRDAPVPIEIERDHKGRELEVEAYRYARGLHAKGT